MTEVFPRDDVRHRVGQVLAQQGRVLHRGPVHGPDVQRGQGRDLGHVEGRRVDSVTVILIVVEKLGRVEIGELAVVVPVFGR